ncbi:hemolysin family protein [Mariniblastus fucicola]|uniref:Magnesium and cobalt efflux protein CorC n=1 Tax=Mariniblastus fucicola TaxID=980251 RepID=A0A5B9PA13_9BACT|nr:hemolysin family protein [Mariniblastus fucicola]QEG22309.1 Magnesium and cobalt efflux protein CorC [Mariniblastus fucicola]
MNTAVPVSLAQNFALLALDVAAPAGHDAAPTDDGGGGYGFYFGMLGLALLLVVLNGFFVAAEFALVKIRRSQINKLVLEKRLFAKSAKWLFDRMDHSLSACQLGITMASLGLGWVGEPAFAKLLEPVFKLLSIGPTTGHIIAFIVAFSMITALHLVVGEQAPKIFAIREPVKMLMWCAAPMRFFYYLLFPFMYALNWVTNLVLARLGLTGETGHGAPHNEEEIRAMLTESHTHGFLSRSEHSLMNAVMEFDDMLCRLVMVPRVEVQVMDINLPFPELMAMAKETQHTRYPVVDSSLDSLLGVVHMKDLLGVSAEADFDIRSIMREPTKVPESMPISQVLRHFQSTHQLLSFVIDEYGSIIGIVTLENVLEKIIGPVDDEFDVADEPSIKQVSSGQFLVLGNTHIADVEAALGLNLDDEDADTVAGVLMSRLGKIPEVDDKFEFEGAVAHVIAVNNDRVEKIRFVILDSGVDTIKPPIQ